MTPAAQVKEIFRAHCLECHGGTKTRAGVKILDRDRLVAREVVIPGRPDESELYLLVTARDEPVMPPPDQPRLRFEQMAAIRTWIADGAPAFPPDPIEPPLPAVQPEPGGEEAVLRAILNDVRALPGTDRPSARYFSLHHLRASGIEEEELESHRAALTKAINHLSWQREIVLPVAIDPERTIYRIDLRALGWDAQPFEVIRDDQPAGASPLNLFDLALLEYPYGLRHRASATFDALTAEFLTPAGQVRPIPYLRADWFVSVATQPPLYEDFLQLPRELKDLESRLGVDVATNLEQFRARRAGVVVSGVSHNNRAVERHPTQHGAYWKTFDFRCSKADENLFRDPLDLHPAGGEIIFNLPNGLQGYFLVDAAGRRLAVAPTEIVTDKNAADQVVRNGLSCIRCHDAGMKGLTDAVRPALERLPDAPGFDKARALRLYAQQDELDGLLKQDTDRFSTALRRTLGSLPALEPVTIASRRYLDEPISLATAAAELGLSDVASLRPQFGTRDLIGLGLAPLATGGVVRRDSWEDAFDRVVRALGLGVPLVPFDGLTRRDVQPESPRLDAELATNHKNNLFTPGDELVITATNLSRQTLYFELIGTGAQGRKVLLTPRPEEVPAGQALRIPPQGFIRIQEGLGAEQITLIASDAPFAPGELLRGRDVADRVVHPAARPDAPELDPARTLKQAIAIETR